MVGAIGSCAGDGILAAPIFVPPLIIKRTATPAKAAPVRKAIPSLIYQPLSTAIESLINLTN
jgi:hypothetical protein